MIYTIGYAGTDINRFIEILKNLNVSFLIDVRSLPKSKYFYQFNDNSLSKKLYENNIKYENWKYEFGARQDNLSFYTEDILDYQKFANSSQFKQGIEKVTLLADEGFNLCLMCSEIDPINCHRAILCSRHIFEKNLQITHIIAKRNGETIFENEQEFRNRLLLNTKVNNLEEAYQKQNKKIGYKLTNEK